MAETGKTCAPDWEELYQKVERENRKLREECQYLERQNREIELLKAQLEIVYLIFGRGQNGNG
ncbi:MAG: hypothetical protein IJ306_02525 [Oscillospiraceae bacterium]|nr:hypothetical protein [Oscillospiraceae bacterium]